MPHTLELELNRSYHLVTNMGNQGLRGRATAIVSPALWLVGLLMLLAFPLQRIHSSSSHFRTPEVRRSVLRHTTLERTPQSSTTEEAYEQRADFARLVEDCDESEPAFKSFPILTVSVWLFLTRLKLGPSHDGGQDPLLN